MSKPSQLIGLPRALVGYLYLPLWATFFQALGIRVMISGETTRSTLDEGVRLAVDEACLPVKVYFGHVAQLVKTGVDLLFLPRLVRIEKRAFICPKFMGLPDMVRAGIPGLPPLLDPVVDVQKKSLTALAVEVGKRVGASPLQSWWAWRKAMSVYRWYRSRLREEQTFPEQVVRWWQGATCQELSSNQLKLLPKTKGKHSSSDLTVGVLGHPYNVYDSFVNMQLIKVLARWGVRVVTADMLPPAAIEREARSLPKEIFWTFGHRMAGAAYYWFQQGGVDGIIHVVSFGCGPDSLVGELLQREAARRGKPAFLLLTIDEHTGEAGFLTRVEAFLDMIRRQKEVVTACRK